MIRAIILLVIAITPLGALAQLPMDIKSDLGEGVPPLRVRPGYRVTRAVPDDAIRPGGRSGAGQPSQAQRRVRRGARFLQFSADGKTLFLSQSENGTILALRDPNDGGVFQNVTVFVKDKPSAHGLDWHDGWLYFGQSSEGAVSRARDTNGDGVADDVQTILPKGSVPAGGGHPFEGILVTDKQLFVTCSDPTNMTADLDSDRKKIYVFDFDGEHATNRKVFVSGVRNVEKIRYRPGTNEIWGFDHGSDNFGGKYGENPRQKDQPITDLNPPEEFDLFVQDGFYGHPYLSGNRVPRPEFANRPDILDLARKTIAPEWNVHAHWAVLGWTFIEKDYFPGHKGDVFFAAHGSWNSSKPVGACVERLMFDQVTGKPYGSLTIVDCAGPDRRYARPVDCVEAPDGTILFTSDEPPALYRISRSQKTPVSPQG
jgi:glucose/arabinose dehydrogenase